MLKNLLQIIKNHWVRLGGIKSKKVWFLIFLVLWAFYVFLREHGLLRKKSLKGKHVFITGAGLGLGREMAIKFVRMGAYVSISDINEKTLMETK